MILGSRLLRVLVPVVLSHAAPVGAQPVQLVNARKGEVLTLREGRIPSPRVLNRFFRCRRDSRYTLMDPRVVAAVAEAIRHLGGTKARVISAFRTGRFNEELRSKGHHVALRSRHIHGQAIDFRIPGVPTRRLCAYLRKLKFGGVGCYRRLRMVHLDVGPVRTWDG